TQLVAAVSGRAAIDGTGLLLAHMRRNARGPKSVDKSRLVESSVGAQGDAPAFGKFADHLQRRVPLGVATGLGESRVDRQAVAILHQDMPQEGQLRLCARGFLVQPGFRIAARLVRVVLALVPVKVRFGVASAIRPPARGCAAVLRSKALLARPGL